MKSMIVRALKALRDRLSGPNPLPGSDSPRDPFAGIGEPRRRGPAGRGTAAAVAEPEPARSVDAVGRRLV